MNISGTIQGICHGGIQKLASGIEKLGVVFGNWKVIRKLASCIRKLAFGNWNPGIRQLGPRRRKHAI
jgi:hypothetical protein